MIKTHISNPCIRCGKERIVVKTWEEKIKTYSGFSLQIRSDTACPDIECQVIVEEDLKQQKEKREKRKQASINDKKERLSKKITSKIYS